MTWEFIVLGILLLAIFLWRVRRARPLGFSDFVLLGFGIGAFLDGLFGPFGVTP